MTSRLYYLQPVNLLVGTITFYLNNWYLKNLKFQISLCYSPSQRQLVVTIHRAVDLAPRPDGVMRNPYVKIFLLPDRRQTLFLFFVFLEVFEQIFYKKIIFKAVKKCLDALLFFSEKSRRQSAVLAETCTPIWEEPFYYHGLTEAMLIQRVLEVGKRHH